MSAAQRQGKSYRSYGQLEAEYRIGRNMLLEGDLLSVYSRVFADTGENGGDDAGEKSDVRHRSALEALRDRIFFIAVEQQLPLNCQKWRIRYHAARQRLIL